MSSKTFEVIDDNHKEYEVHTDSFSRGSPPSWDDPGDGPEWCGANIVDVTYYDDDGKKRFEDVVTWETFLIDYAIYRHLTLDKAEDAVTEAMIEMEYEHASERDCDY